MTTELTKGAMAKRRLPELWHNLSAWAGPSREGAHREPPAERRTEGSLLLVERPVDRSVLWLPGGWGEQRTGRPYPNELFVEQAVLRDVEAHALEEIEGSYGLLSGRLLACRVTRIPFVSVEAAHRSETPMPVGEDLSSFREFFWKIGEQVGRQDRVLVGWYHTHSLLGLQLSERDRQLHVAHFQDDWTCALVVVTRRGESEGGFFQRDRGDILFRRSTRPFREIVSQRVESGGGPYVTSVAWGNYWTHEPVLYARKPGDLPSKGGKWSWRQRPRVGPRKGKTLADLAATLAEETAVDSSGDLSSADLQGSARAEDAHRRESAGPTYERAMGRPSREDGIAGSVRPLPAGPPPTEAWDEWKKALGARREREEEVLKAEAEQAAVEAERAEADADARAKAALAARTAAEAAAQAAAEALGIGSEGDAISAEAVSMAERDTEALVVEDQAAKRAAERETPKKKAAKKKAGEKKVPAAKKEPAETREPKGEEAKDEVPAEPAAGTVDTDEEVDAKSGEVAAESGAEAVAVAEPGFHPTAELEPEQIEIADVEVPAPTAKLEHEPEPEEEIPAPEMAAGEDGPDRGERVPAPAEVFGGGEVSADLAKRAAAVARSSWKLGAEGEMVVPPLVLPDPEPRAKLRRYAAWLGVGIPLAAALAWILLG